MYKLRLSFIKLMYWSSSVANTFFEDGARVINEPTMVSGDWQKFIPNVGPGEIAASELNPICWPPKN